MPDTVCVWKFANLPEAELARQILEDEGIPSSVSTGKDALQAYFGFVTGEAGVSVLKENAEQALDILESKFGGRPAVRAKANVDDADVTFVCEECGHAISLPAKNRGRVGTCPVCHEYVDVPD